MRNSERRMKSSLGQVQLRGNNLSAALQRLMNSLAHLFAAPYRAEENENEDEGLVVDMEIGFPTDVKHVTHIGIDGCGCNRIISGGTALSNWVALADPELLITSLPAALALQHLSMPANPTI